MPPGAPEDVYVTALSGGNLLGMARIQDVSITAGKKSTYDAPLRKPLVFVGSMLPAEMGAANKTSPVQILDPLSSDGSGAHAGHAGEPDGDDGAARRPGTGASSWSRKGRR